MLRFERSSRNADNGHEQNVLACFRKDPTCRRPILYVDDLGAVFGYGGGTTRLRGAQRDYVDGKIVVWRDKA